MTSPVFKVDWVSSHIPNWINWLSHLKGTKAVAAEIGSFEGRSAIWMLENILTHEEAGIYCFDPHGYEDEQAVTASQAPLTRNHDIEKVHERFMANTAKYRPAKLTYHRCGIQEGVKGFNPGYKFDCVYIDGSHIASAVLSDACHIWPYVKPGGIVIFDDYHWRHSSRQDKPHLWCPKLGIDNFLQTFETQYELISKGYQVAIKKRE
jgi:predicted O-methyltransferase YrrM